mgnify:CR=1 FL=1
MIDLRRTLPIIRDQGPRPTCLSCALSDLHQSARGKTEQFSSDCLFYYANQIHGHASPAGISPRSARKALREKGQCLESEWPYDINPTTSLTPPRKIGIHYKAIATVNNSTTAIIDQSLQSKEPVVLVLRLTKKFLYTNGIDPLIYEKSDKELGSNHAVVVMGVQSTNYIIRNSWGIDWGDKGHALVGSCYINQLSTSMLQMRIVL